MTTNYSCADKLFLVYVIFFLESKCGNLLAENVLSLGIKAILVWFGSESLMAGIFWFPVCCFLGSLAFVPGL